jgi:hypothetical protein
VLTTHREPSHARADTVGGTEARAKWLTPRRNANLSEAHAKQLTPRRKANLSEARAKQLVAAPHHGLALFCSLLA